MKEALVREVQEETGYHVIIDSIKKYGTFFERRRGTSEDVLEMNSHYFFCEVEAEVSVRNLDEYEKEYNYKMVWLTLPEAIEKISK
ncbi:MAG: NUDIX domain-containing protein [Clostridiales bacterium]|nr:NUDIX domain-containing protein [Clostridiales bacterium]